jgi:ABC-2 type transport system permease protein
VGTTIADAIKKFIYVVPMFIFLGYRTEMRMEQWLYAGLAVLLSVVVFVSLGVIIATTAVMYKQVGSIAGILGLFFDFFAGAYIPVILFPKLFQGFALIFPHAYAYDLVRYYAFDGQWQTLLPIWLEWLLLGLNFLFYIMLSRLFLRKVEKYAKKNGLHLI